MNFGKLRLLPYRQTIISLSGPFQPSADTKGTVEILSFKMTNAGRVEKPEPCALVGGNSGGATTMEGPQQLEIKLPCDPATSLPGASPKETKALSGRDICTPTFTAALCTMSRCGNKLSVHQRWDICTTEHHFPIKKEMVPFSTTWIDLEDIVLRNRKKKKDDNSM